MLSSFLVTSERANPELYTYDRTTTEEGSRPFPCWLCCYNRRLREQNPASPSGTVNQRLAALRLAIRDVFEHTIVNAGQAGVSEAQPVGDPQAQPDDDPQGQAAEQSEQNPASPSGTVNQRLAALRLAIRDVIEHTIVNAGQAGVSEAQPVGDPQAQGQAAEQSGQKDNKKFFGKGRI
uniref:Uncharacterized protein n=1 Tax=Panagrolaimus sp. PS1159 TaxID=55785 RepID=A0AC35FF18_9BILA